MAGHLAFHTEVVNVICEVIKIHNKSPIGLYARSIFTGPKYLIDVCAFVRACILSYRGNNISFVAHQISTQDHSNFYPANIYYAHPNDRWTGKIKLSSRYS